MRTAQATQIRKLRMDLGRQIMAADDVAEPLALKLERGQSWSDAQIGNLLSVAEYLVDIAVITEGELRDFVSRYTKSLRDAERSRLREAVQWLRVGIRELRSISSADIAKIAESTQVVERIVWRGGKKRRVKDVITVEEYLTHYYRRGRGSLVLAWTSMFYATAMIRAMKVVLTTKQTALINDPESQFWKVVVSDADNTAKSAGKMVEVHDAEGDIVYIAHPPEAPTAPVAIRTRAPRQRWEWRPGRKLSSSGLTFSRQLTPDERKYVQEMVEQHPGVTIQEVAEGLDVDVVPVTTAAVANPCYYGPNSDAPSAQELNMMRQLWDKRVFI